MPRAPRRCPTPGCTELIRSPARYCIDHTEVWAGGRTASDRICRTTQWRKLRTIILERDRHTCQIRYPDICTGHATTVDKIQPAARRPDLALEPANLQAACWACQMHKCQTEDKRRPA